ncbi:MAG TPA: hypothetical protein VEX86_18185 [Longimicrobium sp.]|nr:hypothetical protein [Longimicrobium sp.]
MVTRRPFSTIRDRVCVVCDCAAAGAEVTAARSSAAPIPDHLDQFRMGKGLLSGGSIC